MNKTKINDIELIQKFFPDYIISDIDVETNLFKTFAQLEAERQKLIAMASRLDNVNNMQTRALLCRAINNIYEEFKQKAFLIENNNQKAMHL